MRTPNTVKKARPAPNKGHVEIFRLTDEDYFNVYVDGQYAEFLGKSPLSSVLLNRRFRQELANKAGVAEDDLRFTLSQPVWTMQDRGLEMGEVTYADMVAWRTSNPHPFDFAALDLAEMEQAFIDFGW